MARWLSFDERARIEAMRSAGVSTDVDDTARDPVPDLCWRGRVAHVAGQDVYATDARRLFRPSLPTRSSLDFQ